MDNLNGMMKAFLMLSDLDNNDNIKSKVKYKERIVFATMKAQIPDWEQPKDWETLTDTEKLKRLELIQEMK
tara:strand:- start:502 stop:714 length:213 start_codon:yes stop_codon:yes gene_type:complete